MVAPIVACYLVALAWPGPGLLLRHVRLDCGGVSVRLSAVLLSVTLFAAVADGRLCSAGSVAHVRGLPALGFGLKSALPVLLIPALAASASGWDQTRQTTSVWIGCALVLSVQLCGGTAADRAVGADPSKVAVLGSLLLSPVTIPLGLRCAARPC